MRATDFFIGGAITLAAASAASADDVRAKLAGYQDYAFGMSEANLRKHIEVTGTSADSKSKGTWLYSDQSADINGDKYALMFLVDGGVLFGVQLQHNQTVSRIACAADFKETVGLVQAKYGAPDGPPDVMENVIGYIANAKFTFQDGGLISVVGTIIGQKSEQAECSRMVIYRQGSGGSF